MKNMISHVQDPNFQFLGTQILYQKVCSELQNLTPEFRHSLKEFIFTHLEDQKISLPATIDKLASIGALIAATSILQEWPNVVENLISFMSKNEHNIQSGLYILERIPEELRLTNRVAVGLKNNIIDEFLKKEKELSDIFLSVINMNNNSLVKKCIQAMESWAKSRFNFLRYPEIVKKVLLLSIESFDKFEPSLLMILETIKGASANRSSISLSDWEPQTEMKRYCAEEIESIKLIIQYIVENEKNFISGNVEMEMTDMYFDVIKQSLVNFSFLIAEKIGFDLLNIIVIFTSSPDLRTSQNTFEFWIDFMEKMAKCKIQKELIMHFAQYVEKVFNIVCSKTMVDSESLLEDPDLKEDVTIDDINAMTFAEYRRECSTLFQYIYKFFLDITGSPQYYFDRCFTLLGNESTGKLGKGTELALFCIKSPSESMITEQDSEFICKFVGFVIERGTQVYPRIAVQNLLLIKDCTREIKRDNELCLKALKYSLFYLSDEKICHYAAESFKIIMETLSEINDPTLIESLLSYYSSQAFPTEHIIDKIIEGIFLAITKTKSMELIEKHIRQLMNVVLSRFENVHQNLGTFNSNRPYFIPVIELKTVIDNFDSAGNQIKTGLHALYQEILTHGLKMISIVIPYCLAQNMNYSKFNEFGISFSIYKLSLNLCQGDIFKEHLHIIDQILSVLNKEQIVEQCCLLDLLCWTMTHFVSNPPKPVPSLDAWLRERLPQIDTFFLTYMEKLIYTDADVIRTFFEIQECIVLYNSKIFLETLDPFHIYELGMYTLRHINEPKMQRKVVNFLYVCTQMEEFSQFSVKMVENIIGSIPITSNICHNNLSKTFLLAARRIPNIQEILLKCLSTNPYESLSTGLVNLLVNLILFTVQSCDGSREEKQEKERHFMMIMKDLQEFAKYGEIPQKATLLEIRFASWKNNKNKNNHA